MKTFFIKFLLIFSIVCINNTALTSEAKNTTFDYEDFGAFPVLHEGRVKPLSSLSKNCFYDISQKDNITSFESVKWLAELFFNKKKSYDRKVFYIKNKELLINLNLNYNKEEFYSLNELFIALEKRSDLIKLLQNTPRENLTSAQALLLEIYFKVLLVLTLSNTTDFVNSTFKDFCLNGTTKNISQYEFLKNSNDIKNLSDGEYDFKNNIIKQFNTEKNDYICLIPANDTNWFSLESSFFKNHTNAEYFLNLFGKISLAYVNNDSASWKILCKQLKLMSLKTLSQQTKVAVYLENFYNKVSPLSISMFFYFASFVLSVLFFLNLSTSTFFVRLVVIIFTLGFIIHGSAIVIRVLITHRPPITSLYESIIFVNLMFVLIVLILSLKLRSQLSTCILIGSFSAFLLQYVGHKLGLDGDNFKNLMSVLNTNFWLITHVITISLGYALCLIVGFFGHVYLYFYIKHGQKTEFLIKLNNLLLMICILALFFSLTGTVLGGVWADQSWGRFWGWDPKENGALFIVLWLVFMLHFRMISYFSSLFFAIGMILNNVIVFITWFGVNLLNIGLHTYGFIQNMGKNLFLFCCFEFLYILIFVFILFLKKHGFKQKKLI